MSHIAELADGSKVEYHEAMDLCFMQHNWDDFKKGGRFCEERDNSIYLGRGHIYSINGVLQNIKTLCHFWKNIDVKNDTQEQLDIANELIQTQAKTIKILEETITEKENIIPEHSKWIWIATDTTTKNSYYFCNKPLLNDRTGDWHFPRDTGAWHIGVNLTTPGTAQKYELIPVEEVAKQSEKVCKNCGWSRQSPEDNNKFTCDNEKMQGLRHSPDEIIDEISVINYRNWNKDDLIKIYVGANFGCVHWKEKD